MLHHIVQGIHQRMDAKGVLGMMEQLSRIEIGHRVYKQTVGQVYERSSGLKRQIDRITNSTSFYQALSP